MPTALCWPLRSPPAALSIAAVVAAAAPSPPPSPFGASTSPPVRSTARASNLSSRSERRVGTAGYCAVAGRAAGGWAFMYQASFRIPATSTRFSGSVLSIRDRRYIAPGTTIGRTRRDQQGLFYAQRNIRVGSRTERVLGRVFGGTATGDGTRLVVEESNPTIILDVNIIPFAEV